MNVRETLSPSLQLKLLSLLFAALLWLFVALEKSDEADIPLAVTYANIPPGLKVKTGAPRQSHVHAVGPRILLLRQRLKGLCAKLDLSAVKEGKTTLAGFEGSLLPVSGVSFTRVSPVAVDIILDPATSAGPSNTNRQN
jgi:hypothetical protein